MTSKPGDRLTLSEIASLREQSRRALATAPARWGAKKQSEPDKD